MDYLRLGNKDLQGWQELEVITTGKKYKLFLQKDSILDVRLSSTYTLIITIFIDIVILHNQKQPPQVFYK